MAALFDSAFLRRLEALKVAARRIPAGGRPAEQRSAQAGSGVEFEAYRAYTAGEDLRRVDWRVWQRLGRLFLRLFVEEQDLPVHILLDVSGSIFLPEERGVAARRLAGALAWIAAIGHDRVRLHPFAGSPLPTHGPVTGREGATGLLNRLESMGPAGGTEPLAALRRLRGAGGRRGLLAVVSDFFFAGAGLEPVLAELAAQRHRLLLLQLFHPEDAAPSLSGELRLVECESGETREVTATPEALAACREAHAAFQARLEEFARARRAGLLRIDVTGDVIAQLERAFPGGRLEA